MQSRSIKMILLFVVPAALVFGLTMRILPAGTSGPPVLDSPVRQRLQRCLDDSIAEIIVPGAVMLVGRPDGTKWVGASGFSRITDQTPLRQTAPKGDDPAARFSVEIGSPDLRGRPMETDLRFPVASIAKSFIATVILQLAGEEILSLDDSVEKWLPGLVPAGDRITIRQLMNHTSGLPCYVENPAFSDAMLADPLRKWKPEELVQFSLAEDMSFEPGQGWAYSNTNYILLGMIIEKAAGLSCTQQVTNRIIEPLGLKNTVFINSAEVPGRFSHGYRFDFGYLTWKDYTGYADPSWIWAAGALVSNARDLAVWLDALIDGRLLGPRYKKEMFDFVPTGEPSHLYGLGLAWRNGAVGHTGDYYFGYQSLIFRYGGYDFVILTNGLPARNGLTDGPARIFWNAVEVLFPHANVW